MGRRCSRAEQRGIKERDHALSIFFRVHIVLMSTATRRAPPDGDLVSALFAMLRLRFVYYVGRVVNPTVTVGLKAPTYFHAFLIALNVSTSDSGVFKTVTRR